MRFKMLIDSDFDERDLGTMFAAPHSNMKYIFGVRVRRVVVTVRVIMHDWCAIVL